MTDIVLFNSGKTPITGTLPDGTPYKLLPQKALCFPPEEAAKLKRLFRDDLIDEADARAKFSPAAVMADVARISEIAETPPPAPMVPPAPPEKIVVLTNDDKVSVAKEIKELIKKLNAKGMSTDEIEALFSSANLGATIELEQQKQQDEQNAGDAAALQSVDEAAKKGLITRILDRL